MARPGNDAPPCIWVSAGVLNYRLCDREYQCERCELFHALRRDFQATGTGAVPDRGATTVRVPIPLQDDDVEARTRAYVSRFVAGCRIHLDRTYSPGHVWVDDASGRVTLGLDPVAVRVLRPIDDVIAPCVGARVDHCHPCAWIRRGRLTIPLASPVGGDVEAVNAGFVALAGQAASRPGADPWILRLRGPVVPEPAATVFRGEETLRWFVEQIGLLTHHVGAALQVVSTTVGRTLQDGGVLEENLERVLGRERYEAFALALFRVQI